MAGQPVNWATATLDILDAPLTPDNYHFLNQWVLREHGNFNMYANNPFFTTAGAGGTVGPFKAGTYPTIPDSVSPGAHAAGVAVYPDLGTGVAANAIHIGSEYPAIAAALRSGHPQNAAGNPAFQSDLRRWSGSGYTGFAGISAPSGPVGPTITLAGGSNLSALQRVAQGKNPLQSSITGAPGSIAAGVGGAVSGAVGAVESVGSFLGRISSRSFLLRMGEVVGGVILTLAGMLLLARQVGLANAEQLERAAPPPARAAARSVPSSFGGE